MKRIKCACNEKSCRTSIYIDEESKILWFADYRDNETAMFLNSRNVIHFMKELIKYLFYNIRKGG